MQAQTLLRLSRSHRLLGMVATIPIVGWILSSFVLHGVGLLLPNGLAGVYDLKPYHEHVAQLQAANLASPTQALARLRADGLDRVYWLRLEVLGKQVVYIAKPGPFEPERVYDAYTLERLDPLPEATLRTIADDQLIGTTVAEFSDGAEFNRYYTLDQLPAVEFVMEREQPSKLVISRLSGRTLRRTNPAADLFATAYRSVHVWQWGDSVLFFSVLLYAGAGIALLLVLAGYTLWWTRRENRRRWTKSVPRARRFHGALAPIAGLLLATQMLVGAYLWFNLGLIEPQFRGQGSFRSEWAGGIAVSESLATPAEILAMLPELSGDDGHPIQRFEWRKMGEERFWIIYPQRNANGVLVHAASRQLWDRIPESLAATAGASVVLGEPVGPGVESTEYWMDFNARVATYRFRFTDPDDSDIHVSQITGEVVQRRPAIWRAFGPFLTYHTFGFTGNKWFDTALLSTLQILILLMVISGWFLALPRARKQK